MTTIFPPPNRKDFKSEKAYKESYNKWKKCLIQLLRVKSISDIDKYCSETSAN